MRDHIGKQSRADRARVAAHTPAPTPGKRTLVEQAETEIVQRRASNEDHGDEVHAAAARGTATPGGPLPYADRLQRAFGRHNISSVQAHAGPEAASSAQAMGARAYATGNHVVLDGTPDLFTVAHEAAHVIQQRSGVQLRGDVGEVGDPYERHADEVASRVVQGASAEDLLDAMAGGAEPAPAVQRMLLREWHHVKLTKIHGASVSATLRNEEIRRALVERNAAQLSIDASGLTPEDLQWRPGKQESKFERLMMSEAYTVMTFKEDLQAILPEPAPEIRLVYATLSPGNSLNIGVSNNDVGDHRPATLSVPWSELENGTECLQRYFSFLATSLVAYPCALEISVGQDVKASIEPTPQALRSALLEPVRDLQHGDGPISVFPVAFDMAVLQERYAQRTRERPRPWQLGSEESGQLDEIHPAKPGDAYSAELANKLYHSDALVIRLVQQMEPPVTVTALQDANREIQMSGTNQERTEKTEGIAGVLRGKGEEVALPVNASLTRGEDVEAEIEAFVKDYNACLASIGRDAAADVAAAVDMHQRLVRIHPFKNGNGRVARMLLYKVLLTAGLPMVRLDPKDPTYAALSGLALKNKNHYQQELVRRVMELQLTQLD